MYWDYYGGTEPQDSTNLLMSRVLDENTGRVDADTIEAYGLMYPVIYRQQVQEAVNDPYFTGAIVQIYAFGKPFGSLFSDAPEMLLPVLRATNAPVPVANVSGTVTNVGARESLDQPARTSSAEKTGMWPLLVGVAAGAALIWFLTTGSFGGGR